MVEFLLGLVDPWLYIVVFVLAFAEGGALLGLFIPGESAMLLAGWLVSQGRASLGGIIAVAAAGSVLGDSVGYWTGWRFGARLRNSGLGRRIAEERWGKAERFMLERGKAAVAIGRFVSIFRTLVPPLAGSSGMAYRDFVVYNSPAAALWATALVLLGAFAGDRWDSVAHWTGRAGKTALALVLAGFVVTVVVRQLRKRRMLATPALRARRDSNPRPSD